MNIKAQKGTKVKFKQASKEVQRWAGCDTTERLVDGQIYTVKSTEIHSMHTKVQLEEVGGYYNSVMFEEV